MLGSIINSFGFGVDAKSTTGTPISTLDGEESFAEQMKKETAKAAAIKETTLAGEESAETRFLNYQKMSIGEKVRASYLAAHKLTEEDVAAMSPEEQEKLEKLIMEDLKRKLDLKEIQNASAA